MRGILPLIGAFGPGVFRRSTAAGRTSTIAAALAIFAATVAILAVPAAAAPNHCIGLDCGSPVSPDYVPEAHGAAPAVAGIDQLLARGESGFYEIPALVYQGDVQPRAVVYLAKPGQFGRMPSSVRNLGLVREVELAGGSEVATAILVVIDRGILLQVIPADTGAAARRRQRAKAAKLWAEAWTDCGDKHFCLWDSVDWEGFKFVIDGPTFVGTGWHNFSASFNNWANSMVNRRDGDSLLATGTDGDGARYCASQQSFDSTFSNNFGNNVASSWALLGSGIDRC